MPKWVRLSRNSPDASFPTPIMSSMVLTATPSRALAPVERAVLLTLAYSDVFDYPLTAGELGRYIVDLTSDDRFESVSITDISIDGGGRDLVYDSLGGTIRSALSRTIFALNSTKTSLSRAISPGRSPPLTLIR